MYNNRWWDARWEVIPALLFFVFAGVAIFSQDTELTFVFDLPGIAGGIAGALLFFFLMAQSRRMFGGSFYEASDSSDVDSGK